MTTLVCVAHPDDEVIGAGGTIAKLAKTEDVYVVVFSKGDEWPFWRDKKIVVEERREEIKKASDILHVKKVFYLNLQDTRIGDGWSREKEKELHSIFVKCKPTKVFTHTKRDYHIDHADVNKLVNAELSKHKDIQKFYFEVSFWSTFMTGAPKIIFDISDTYSLKISALEVFKSQKFFIRMLKPLIVLKSYYYGKKNRCSYAEYFLYE